MNLRIKAHTSRALEYLLVVAASCTFIGIRYLLHPWLQGDVPLLILIVAPVVSSLYGARPALVSTALCLLAGWYFFIAPFNSFSIQSFTDVMRLGIFTVAGCVIGFLGELRRKAQSSVDVSRQRQELAVEAADLGVFEWDIREDKSVWENERMYEIFGYNRAEVPFNRQEFYDTCLHQDDVVSVKAAIQRGIRPGRNFHTVCRIMRKSDKALCLVELSGKFLFDSESKPYKLIGVARDITEQKAREDVTQSMHVRLQALLDNVPAYIYQMDRQGNYEFANRAYAELVGLSADAMVGRSVSTVFRPEDVPAFMAHNEEIFRSGEQTEFEEQALLNGTLHYYTSIKTPLFDDKNNPVSVLGISTDITERKRIEQEMRDSERRKDEFLAVLGHELRNPLAPLRAGIELLEHEAGNPTIVEGIRTMMHRQLAHLVRLVDDLLNMSRISRGLVELQSTNIDLNMVIQVAVEQVRPALASRNHGLALQLAEHPLIVFGDFDRLTQVIVNLLSNAAKFTPPGGRVGVTSYADDGAAVVEVVDSGFGIPATHLKSIFDMFIQVQEHKLHSGGEGLGIGLALSRQFVEQHNGSIEASSKGEGQGSQFIIRIPLHDKPIQAQLNLQAAREDVARRVLVVDDNQDAALSLCALLKLKGHTAQAVHDGPAALARLPEFSPEVVLMDIGMPGMNGYEVARLIRALPDGHALHLIALTGWGQKADKLNASAAGFDAHLTKPVDTELLWNLLAQDSKRGNNRSQ